jgi:uncharacterized membrane protein YciS (DUF1049 family)
MDPYAAWHVAQATTSQSAAAETLARLILSTTAFGLLVGLVLVTVFAVWISVRLRRMEQCLERMRENRESERTQ